MRTRRLVLASRYNAVSAVASIQEIETLKEPEFDVIVLCHTLSQEECDLAVRICQTRWAGAKFVALAKERSKCDWSADRVVRALDGPKILLRAIDGLVANQHYC